MARINEIVDEVQQNFPDLDTAVMERAYVYSAKVHLGQQRLSGEPYLTHPLEVAQILARMRLDPVTVAAGLLHDTVEDTLATQQEIREQFGEEIEKLVSGLTKISQMAFQSQEERQAENFRKMLLAMSKDVRIILIKLADRLHNMRTLEYMDEPARRRVSRETLDIYAPLAHRIGIYWIKQELEEKAFEVLHPEVAREIRETVKGTRKQREKYVEDVKRRLQGVLADAGIRAEVTGRLKEVYSLFQKMQEQHLTLDEVYDQIAFRVVLDGTNATVYEVLGVIHGLWKPVSGRFKDYIAMPKPNGYQSLHTTVIGPFGERMEVQIRTQEMHRVSELGIAAHWNYKGGQDSFEETDEKKFVWLRQLLEWQQHLQDPNEFLESVRIDLFPDEVYVFTPDGDVIALPAGATPIDFAFAVHSEVGSQCAGAKVNGKLVPLRHKLSNGDTVRIITSPHQRPRREWLDHIVTGRARSRVRHLIRLEQVDHARSLGRDILKRELQARGLQYEKLSGAGDLTRVATDLSYKTLDAMLQALAYGRLSARQVVRKLGGPEEETPPSLISRVLGPLRDSGGVKVDGMDQVLVRFGRCCSPLPGDSVTGFITRGRGVTVHARDCSKIFHLDPERRVPVTWNNAVEELRRVKVRVVSDDRRGLLAAVSKQISTAGINIQGGRITSSGPNRSVQDLELMVKDRKHLENLIRVLSKIKGVLKVERLRG
ncbi:MAG: bifunctional (p)ppGpp synthetase/guanosine-3',5'-bis(diphosphate) 3'-pyrophosphohydrolase [Myxococcales bacterium]|nr:bifunctional (p)ppGpp synthetase/guanosine-3',5'-bis(diphosphate) 3'-pyrophosphohydrolase [Myxococcales bacterium]